MMIEQDSQQFLRALLTLPLAAYQPSPPPLPKSRVSGDPRYGMLETGGKAKGESIRLYE